MPQDDSTRHRPHGPQEPFGAPSEAGLGCDAWLEFHCALHEVLGRLNVRVARVDPGVVRLSNGRSLDLGPLVAQCSRRPESDWRDLIERHLDHLIALVGGTLRTVAGPILSVDLRIRLVPASPIEEPVLDSVGARWLTADLAAVMVVSDDETLRAVGEIELAEQGWDLDLAWDCAWAQTEHMESPDRLEIVDVSGVEVMHLSGTGEFAASVVGPLERHVGPLGDDGAIVGVPCDDTVLVHRVDGPASRRAIGVLVPIVRRLHGDGPGALSPQIYWWRNGRLVCIPTVFGGETNEVYLPAGLSDVLA